jgi:hypothetical protein
MTVLSKAQQRDQRIRTLLTKYPHKFDIDMSAIDLREMAKNFPQEIIPSVAITEAVNAVLGPAPVARLSVDPRQLRIPKFAWVRMDDVSINSIFQRDISCGHISGNIEFKWDPSMIIVPCAIKDPITGKYLLWDGNHTRQVCDRMGWTHLPVWYTEADTTSFTDMVEASQALKRKAGESFLVINKTGKRPVDRYNEHMISFECDIHKSVMVQNIVNANNCQVKRRGNNPGDITHIANLYNAYELTQASTGIQGIYLSRSLRFHRATWPMEEVGGVMMLAMARLYEITERSTGVLLPPEFDIEFGDMLKNLYGFSGAVYGDDNHGLKGAFIAHFGSIGNIPQAITSGLILTYLKHGTQGFKLGAPEDSFPVK